MEINANAEHGIINRVTNSVFAYQGWGSVCRDEAGVLYAVASGMRMGHVCPFGKTVMYISRDGGNTWAPPMVINDDYLDDRDAGILYMGNGRMLVTWFSHSRNAYENRYYRDFADWKNDAEREMVKHAIDTYQLMPEELAKGGSFLRISEDYGVTWSEPVKVRGSAPHGPNMLRDGSLIYLAKDMYITEEDNNTHGHIRAYRSLDGGYHWDELAILPVPENLYNRNFHEPYVIELPDGRLLGAIRAQGPEIAESVFDFTVYLTVSEDGGLTWTTPEPTGIHGSPPHLMLHSSGALICSFGRRITPYSERAMVSYDMGKTWPEEYILDVNAPDHDMGYPASVELDDGSIITVYYQKVPGDTKCSMLYSRWRLKEWQ